MLNFNLCDNEISRVLFRIYRDKKMLLEIRIDINNEALQTLAFKRLN